MEVQEISNRLDYALSKAEGGIILDEYNKSLYLTKAQTTLVEAALTNYEYGDILRHILGKLIQSYNATTFVSTEANWYTIPAPTEVKSVFYEVLNTDNIKVIPLDYNDIHKIRNNPFRKPDKKIAYRVTGNNIFSIFTTETPVKYTCVYCKEPGPVVLENLPTTLAIKGVNTPTTSVLPYDSIIKIIELAVRLILQDKQIFSSDKKEEAKE